jgi:hypothetical protein
MVTAGSGSVTATAHINVTALGLAQGGFETPNVGTGGSSDYKVDPTGSAWAFAGPSGLAGNASSLTSANPRAPQGTQVAFLQKAASISQSFKLDGGRYRVTFQAARRARQRGRRESIEVLLDGKIIEKITPSRSSYASFTSAAFTVATGTHTLTFKGLNRQRGGSAVFVDTVTVSTL